jgi:Helix-turn-helix domain/RodZ C-terminal domain
VFEIGSTLREARVRRKTTLQQAEDDTKIRVKYIQAMENEDFDVMPSPAYVKGFLRTYSQYLGLDPDVMLEEYRSRFEPDEEHEPFGGHSALGRPRAHRRRNTLAFVAVICLLILGLLYLLGRGYGTPSKPSTPPLGATSPTTSPSTSSRPSSHPSASPTHHVFTVRVAAVDGACWLEARRGTASGPILYMATLAQGQVHTFKGIATLYVRLGVPYYAAITINGTRHRPVETVATSYQVTKKGVVRQ